MSYYHAAPPSPTSSASSFSSGPPQTPTSPNGSSRRLSTDYQSSLVIPSLPEYGDYSQKPKVNTAERRASHNAVERARRETLNARFLDLAVLLPNLRHLRRPSKSAIVNSSIAHVRAARRYRQLASHQLRALNAECDMIRREVNQWRARAGIRSVEAPPRSEGFALVLTGEEPAFDPVDLEGEDDEDADYMRGLPHRRAPPAREPACEGPLLLSHPYAPAPASPPQSSPSPPYSNGNRSPQPQSQPRADTATPPATHAHAQTLASAHAQPHPSPVAVSFETPSSYDGFLMQPSLQQGEVWGYAVAPQGQGW
ncbi:hypothetical protein B0H11DRAFT_564560 [Mycena galericulata]|nr:hypothetical protein B0H11DRAFT_564560 [Mycena galericulata]